MRFDGVIKAWDDDRGFGFIAPDQGGQDVFVHIKAVLNGAGERPRMGQRVSFEVAIGPQGKKRAHQVLLDTPSNRRAPSRAAVRHARSDFGTASLLAIPAFAVLWLTVAALGRMPSWTALLYLVLSLVCALAYREDKLAARSGRSRTRESTLLLLGLAGGWPGALIAQQVWRHKSAKQSFRQAFWGTVILHVLGFLVTVWILRTPSSA